MVSLRGAELRVHEGYLVGAAGRSRGDRRVRRGPVARRAARGDQDESSRSPARRCARQWPPRANAARGRAARAEARRSGTRGSTRSTSAERCEPVPIRVSRRMKSRLGHYTAGRLDGRTAGPQRQRRRVGRSRSAGVTFAGTGGTRSLHTLLHEMVHQWQDETGLPIDHGPRFRAKARDVGIDAAAKRAVAHRSS